jgi:hypothetical protein
VNIDDWNDLGFDPTKDGYWATAQEIKDRMKDREDEARKAKLVTLGICFVSVAVFSILLYILL